MAQASSILFVLGAIAVAHRVRRPRRPRRPARQRPSRHRLRPGPPARVRDRRRHRLVRHASTPPSANAPLELVGVAQPALARRDRAHGRGASACCVASLVTRGDRRRARAVREPVRVLRRVRDLDPRRLPVPPAPLPDPPDRLHPGRRVARPAAVRVLAAVGHRGRSSPPSSSRRCSRSTSAWRCSSYGIFATAFAAGIGYLVQGTGGPVRLAAVAQDARRGRLPLGDHRVPDLRDDDHPRLLVGLDRLVALLGLGPQGDRRARDLADVRDLPPRAQPAPVGGPARPRCCSWSGSGWCWSPTRAASGSPGCTPTAGCSGSSFVAGQQARERAGDHARKDQQHRDGVRRRRGGADGDDARDLDDDHLAIADRLRSRVRRRSPAPPISRCRAAISSAAWSLPAARSARPQAAGARRSGRTTASGRRRRRARRTCSSSWRSSRRTGRTGRSRPPIRWRTRSRRPAATGTARRRWARTAAGPRRRTRPARASPASARARSRPTSTAGRPGTGPPAG